jgi:hypothetical protein
MVPECIAAGRESASPNDAAPNGADPLSLERGVRQMLADKVSGDMVGLWLLAPKHLRLGREIRCTAGRGRIRAGWSHVWRCN